MKQLSTLALVGMMLLLLIISGAMYYSFSMNSSVEDSASIETVKVVQYLDSRNLVEAEKEALELAQKYPTNVDVLLTLASVYADRGSTEFQEDMYGKKVIETANKVLALDPQNSEAYRLMGYAYEIMQKYPDAIRAYKNALDLDPQNANAYSNRGHAYQLLGDYVRAKADYDKAIALDRTSDHTLINLARVNVATGHYADARSQLNDVITLSENKHWLATAYQILATLDMSDKNYLAAQDHALKAVANDPSIPQAWVSKGYAEFAALDLQSMKSEDVGPKIEAILNDIKKATDINEYQTSAFVVSAKIVKVFNDNAATKGLLEHALSVVDKDITLGAAEKVAMKMEIQAELKAIK